MGWKCCSKGRDMEMDNGAGQGGNAEKETLQ